ncbi:MAG: helix-turn-helix domain-containing protein, partial [Rubrivivax sp.]|nr:helix-turn-helix domain-containing protein [Rubrivivax sp.]
MRERLDIDNAAAAAVLSRAQSHPLIANLISRACTMRELVDATGMSYSLLSHHLRRLCELGLVKVVGQAPRAGRASALYRATARSFFVPARWCPQLPGDMLSRELRTALGNSASPKGLLIDEDGGPRIRLLGATP